MDSEQPQREQLMDTLLSAFSNAVSPKRRSAYVRATQNIPYEILRRAVWTLIQSWSQFSVPPIAAIRERCHNPGQNGPIPRHRAREVAIRRLAYREINNPPEGLIRLEFEQFPDVLGSYVPPEES